MKLHVKSQIVIYVNNRPSTHIHLRNLFISLHNLIITYIPFIAMYKQLNLPPINIIIFMSGAHGVAGWVWCGGGWVSVDRQLFPPFVVSGWLWSCRVWNAAEVGA